MRRFETTIIIIFLLTTVVLVWKGNIPDVKASSIHQGDLVLTGNNATVIEGRFDINGSIVVEENATLILRNAVLSFAQVEHNQFNMSFQNPVNGSPRLLVENATIFSNDLYMQVKFVSGSALIDQLKTSFRIGLSFIGRSVASVSRSIVGYVHACGLSVVNLTDSYTELRSCGFTSVNIRVVNCTISTLYAEDGQYTVLNSTVDFAVNIGAYNANFSVNRLKPGLISYWNFNLNCSVVIAPSGSVRVPNITLVNTQVNGWGFTLNQFSNVTISDSELVYIWMYDYAVASVYDSIFATSPPHVPQPGYLAMRHNSRVYLYDSKTNRLSSYDTSRIWIVNSTNDDYVIRDLSEAYIAWYLDVHVMDSIGQEVPIANVTATYPNTTIADSELTDANGLARLTLTEKTMNATGEYLIGDYTVEATHGSYSNCTTVNMTENRQITFTLEDFLLPSLLGEGWGRMRIKREQGWVWGRTKLYKIGEEQIQLVISHRSKEYTRVWNIIHYQERKHSETYLCYDSQHGSVIVTICKRWSLWWCRGRGVKAIGFIRNQ